jgi:hypothetical protein
MGLGGFLVGLRYVREIAVVGLELGSAIYTAVRGAKRESEDERAPELVVERERAAGQAASDASRNAGPKVRRVK